MKRLEFSHKNHLYLSLHGESLAVHTCVITFNSTELINLITEFMILCTISKSLVPDHKSEIKKSIPEGTYVTQQFNFKVKDAINEKGNHWVAPEIKDYKLVIPENFAFIILKTFFSALGIPPKHKFVLFKVEY